MIDTQQLTKAFGSNRAVRELDMRIDKGEIVGLLGPNGAGKTTIIRLLNGLLAPTSGQVRVQGMDPIRQGERVRALCGTLTEHTGLYEHMSGRANLRFFADLYHVSDPGRIEELIDLLELRSFVERSVGTYSTGMKKRLGLAKVLLHRPAVLLLDEPTNGLDPDGTKQVLDHIKALNQHERTTILICSHVLSQLEGVCTRYLFLEKGTKIEEGTRKELERKYIRERTVEVEAALGEPLESFAEFHPVRLDDDRFRFTVPDREQMAELLRRLASAGELYGAQTRNADLESIYFQIRRNSHAG
ncbi:ABC transporter ATP-binding protein [Paenibacillus caui]|uniref:ABC transporter ATP-binding protein n=1 Tax=Paenibacillus caui TaxID=2873927 RepID=UPI001CA8852A|nr:ABC transporter ATP-binding protein [Paenibacillus caui]